MALIAANPLRYGIIGGVSTILMIVGRLMIAGLTAFLFYLLITLVTSIKANVQEPVYLVVVVGIGGFAIATVFMSVYDVAVETMLGCFLVDEQSNSKALYAPAELAELMDK